MTTYAFLTEDENKVFAAKDQQYLIKDPYVNPWVTSSKLSGKTPEGISTKNFCGAGKKKKKYSLSYKHFKTFKCNLDTNYIIIYCKQHQH